MLTKIFKRETKYDLGFRLGEHKGENGVSENDSWGIKILWMEKMNNHETSIKEARMDYRSMSIENSKIMK